MKEKKFTNSKVTKKVTVSFLVNMISNDLVKHGKFTNIKVTKKVTVSFLLPKR